MTDDLVKRLNEGRLTWGDRWEAVARIEELERKYRLIAGDKIDLRSELASAQGRIEELEAKLAKAVDTLRNIAVTGYSDDPRVAAAIARQAVDQARATLAELKGGDR